jgi:hypothetical protein
MRYIYTALVFLLVPVILSAESPSWQGPYLGFSGKVGASGNYNSDMLDNEDGTLAEYFVGFNQRLGENFLLGIELSSTDFMSQRTTNSWGQQGRLYPDITRLCTTGDCSSQFQDYFDVKVKFGFANERMALYGLLSKSRISYDSDSTLERWDGSGIGLGTALRFDNGVFIALETLERQFSDGDTKLQISSFRVGYDF